MKALVNGKARDMPVETPVAALVASETASTDGVAVALNGAVVPRSQWELTVIPENATIEILHASQGG